MKKQELLGFLKCIGVTDCLEGPRGDKLLLVTFAP